MNFSPQEYLDGKLLLINKPLNWTSFDVVNKIRFRLRKYCQVKKIKVGHAGTLDPLATGLLLICTGKQTKQIDGYQGMPKSYRATIKLGAETPSYDAETEETKTYDLTHLDIDAVLKAMKSFEGEIDQYPPIYSALKKDGRKLYEFARAGEEVKINPRKITINGFSLVENKWPEIVVDIDCSKGTYIRSLAHDLGKELHIGAYLTGLVRTKVGHFSLDDALNLDEFLAQFED